MKKRIMLMLLCVSMGAGVAQAALKVDFSRTTGAVEADFEAYVADHEQADTFTSQSFEAFGATVTITPSWAEGATRQAMQMIDRSTSGRNGYTGGHTDLLNDWIGTDTRQPGNPMTLTISGLPAGTYSWLSYHHDTDDQTGIFDVTVNDAAGSATTGIDISHSENGSEGRVDGFENTMRFAATVTSNGTDDITLVFGMVTSPSSPVPHLFFVMNGFELSPATKANTPYPADGAIEVPLDAVLSWNIGMDPNDPNQTNPAITQHFVYLLETPVDPNAAPTYAIQRIVAAIDAIDAFAVYVPAELKPDMVYLWAVDEGVNGSQPYDTETILGDTWTFATITTPEPNDVNGVIVDPNVAE